MLRAMSLADDSCQCEHARGGVLRCRSGKRGRRAAPRWSIQWHFVNACGHVLLLDHSFVGHIAESEIFWRSSLSAAVRSGRSGCEAQYDFAQFLPPMLRRFGLQFSGRFMNGT